MSDLSPELARAVEDYDLRVSADLKTVTGSLQFGVVIDGKAHYRFAMHLLTVADDMAIAPDLTGQARMLAVYAQSLDKLGGVPSENLTADFLADNLTATDFDALFFAQELLAKKRQRPTVPANATATPS